MDESSENYTFALINVAMTLCQEAGKNPLYVPSRRTTYKGTGKIFPAHVPLWVSYSEDAARSSKLLECFVDWSEGEDDASEPGTPTIH